MKTTFINKTQSIRNDERGAGMVEYIILAGVVALLSLVSFTEFGENVQTKIGEHGSAVSEIRSK